MAGPRGGFPQKFRWAFLDSVEDNLQKQTIAGPMCNEVEGPDLMEVGVHSEQSGRMKRNRYSSCSQVEKARVNWREFGVDMKMLW